MTTIQMRKKLNSIFLVTLFTSSVYASDLVYVESTSTTSAKVGDTVTLTTTITNNGPDDEANLFIVDEGLGSIENATITTSQGTMYSDGAWDIGTLANGDTITATITGTVGDGIQGGVIPFKLTSYAQSSDPSTDGDVMEAVISIDPLTASSDTCSAPYNWDDSGWNDGDMIGTITLMTGVTAEINISTTSSGTFTNDTLDGVATTPNIDSLNGSTNSYGGVADLGILFDPDADTGTSPVTITLTFSEPVNNASFLISNIDRMKSYSGVGDRVDQVTVTSDVGTPTLETVNQTATVVDVGGNVATAQLVEDKPHNDTKGTVRVTIPDGATKVTLVYEDVDTVSNDHIARGIGMFGNLNICKVPVPVTPTEPDTDGDGIPDETDLDSDGDGVLDENEMSCSTITPLDLSEISDASPNFLNKSLSSVVTFNGNLISDSGEAGSPIGSDAGNLLIKSSNSLTYETYQIDFNLPIGIVFSQGYADPYWFNDTEEYTLTIDSGTLSIHDPDGELGSIVGNNTNSITFVPTSNGSHTPPANSSWSITSTSTVKTVTIKFHSLLETSQGSAILISTKCISLNSDNDTIPNHLDLDSDNDGIPDNVEAQTTADYTAPTGSVDTDGTWAVYGAGLIPVDTDEDNITDMLDTDSDNDTILDADESGLILSKTVGVNGLDDSVDTSDDYKDINGKIDTPSSDLKEDDYNSTDVDYRSLATVPVDSDGDGILDNVDLDDDNDGILDSVEENGTANLDTDGDGIPDRLDLDSDNDGILDLLESGQDVATVDTNNDGVLDSTTDADKDGVMDVADADDTDASSAGKVTPLDTDGDSKPDFQDVDSDNDGMTDLTEVGIPAVNDANNDGMIDGAVDAHGIPTTVASVTAPVNTDGDAVPNYRDLDSDNDGLTDVVESGGTDADGDGLDDTPNATFVDPTAIPDGDTDGTLDPLEPNNPSLSTLLDANGDGVIDDTTDTDNDGIPNVTDESPDAFATSPAVDSDGDGIPDSVDLDDDNDGILDSVEEATASNDGDSDEDGIPDRLDLDSDNDGILDILESGQDVATVDTNNDGVLDSTTDADHDGVMDVADEDDTDASSEGKVTPLDTDVDGKPDFQDVDSDNDSLSDMVEAGVPAENDDDNNGGIDGAVDAHGIPTVVASVTTPVDTDGDTVPNYRDLDSDNDGLNDVEEVDGLDANKDGVADDQDTLVDGTSLPDTDDNKTPDVLEPNNTALPVAVDTDGNGIIDDATDTDKDGIPDATDTRDTVFGTGVAVDSDGDGIVDDFDIDDDNDGIPDVVENRGTPSRDTDGDGIVDSLDLDADNDGILDIVEAGGVDTDNNGRVDDATDSDKDGLADVADVAPTTADNPEDENTGKGTTSLPIPNTDGDTIADFQDIDSDNDGLSDLLEAGVPVNNDADNNGRIDGDVDTNGVPTMITSIASPLDSDSDKLPDYRELDSDGDGKKDVVEAGGEDTDNNGLIDTENSLVTLTSLPDIDNNGTPDYRELEVAPSPTVEPTQQPVEPTPTVEPTQQPVEPTPTVEPTQQPVDPAPTAVPTQQPAPTVAPTVAPRPTSYSRPVYTPPVVYTNPVIEPSTQEETVAVETPEDEADVEEETQEVVETTPTETPQSDEDELVVLDSVETMRVGDIVTIDLLENDSGDLDVSSLVLGVSKDFKAEALLSEDKKTLTVKGEGVWSVDDAGILTFTPEEGFTSKPSAIKYLVANMSGDKTAVATISLNIEAVEGEVVEEGEQCQTSDNVPALSNLSAFLIMLLAGFIGMFFARRENK